MVELQFPMVDIQILMVGHPTFEACDPTFFSPQQCLVLFEAAVARKVIAYLLDLMTIRVCDLVRMLTSYASQIG